VRSSKRTVYVIGAGFSAGLTYPLVHDLLIRLWERLSQPQQEQLTAVIKFHHPEFTPAKRTSFPTIERLLSEMMANEQLFEASRSAPGSFTYEDLVAIRRDLLLAVADWFHEIHEATFKSLPEWLVSFRDKVLEDGDTIISFNWDLVLDELIFGDKMNGKSYGFGSLVRGSTTLLKPHGSLN
jgi:hypothetical protein